MIVWVTGASGMLGTDVVSALGAADVDVRATDLDVDITDEASVSTFLKEQGRVEWIVNCAAYTAVDAAEDNEDTAYLLNALGPRVLARAAMRYGAALVHFSTDYVFDGKKVDAYSLADCAKPASAYGRTKLAGERAVAEEMDRYVVIRTAWLYGVHGKNFVSTMLGLMGSRHEVSVVTDQRGIPTHALDLAKVVRDVLMHRSPTWGVYHYTGAGPTTWFEFAQRIYWEGRKRGLISSECNILPTTSEKFAASAPRPTNSVLDCSDITRDYGVESVPWQNALETYLDLLQEAKK